MRHPAYIGGAVAVLAVVAVAALIMFGSRPELASVPTASQAAAPQTPTATPNHATQPTLAARPTAAPSGPEEIFRYMFVPKGWTMYNSARYGFSIGHPADWTVVPADHNWTYANDATNKLSTGQEVFRPPAGDIRVSAWLVSGMAATTTFNGDAAWAELAEWVEQFCERTSDSPCESILDHATELCNERWDCHPGLLVAFDRHLRAFFTGGGRGGVVVVEVAGGSDPASAQYRGPIQLLETFLMTMEVCLARQDMQPWGYCPQAGPPPS